MVVLDEFPYLLADDPGLPSVLQRFWDSGAPARGRLNLVLCGSTIAQMEELLAERNPLYGRKTYALDLLPLPLRDAARFFPAYGPEEAIVAHAVFGGVPFYLRLCDPGADLRANVLRLLLTGTGALFDEPTVLLQSELRDISRYASILAAVADGCTKFGEITNRVGEGGSKLTPYLDRLARMRLVRAVQSLDAGPKSRDRRYGIEDPLVLFWHRFVRPNVSAIVAGFGEDVWTHGIAPRLDEYMGRAFEGICRAHARRHLGETTGVPLGEVGQVWSGDYDIDVAGRFLDGGALYGECKWSRSPMGGSVLDTLVERADRTAYGQAAPERRFVLYARRGFAPDLHDRARVDPQILLYDAAGIVGAGPG